MSRGLGAVERRILDILANRPLLAGAGIARQLAGAHPPTPAISASARRALASLKTKGLVVQIQGRWMPTATWQRERQREEREAADRQARRARREARADAPRAPTKPAAQDNTRLAKLLGMLSSAHDGEVLAAARMIERERQRLGKTWQEILDAELPNAALLRRARRWR